MIDKQRRGKSVAVMLKDNFDDTFGHRAFHIYTTILQQQQQTAIKNMNYLYASCVCPGRNSSVV